MSPSRLAALAALLVLLVFAGIRIVAMRGDAGAPERLLEQARAQLRDGQPQAAAATARRLLEREPAEGRAFGLLARALAEEGSEAEVLARYRTAARRAPRDVHVRSWLAAHYLQAGDFPRAIEEVDALLTISPGDRRALLAMLAQLAQHPGFAEALAAHLAARPQWRGAVLRAAASADTPDAADNLHGALRRKGDLSPEETARWIDGMLATRRWGGAYARWFSGLQDPPDPLPVPYNGDFGRAPTSTGFDWRVQRTPGVGFARIALPDGGHAARLVFRGRGVGRTGLEVPLLLAPGRHRLGLRARTVDLRSERGLGWVLTCADGRRIDAGAEVARAPEWTPLAFEFDVPEKDCEGQWLRLVNPAPAGAQVIHGELHLTDVRITPVPNH